MPGERNHHFLPPPLSVGRLAGIDAARFVSAVAVLWIHTAESVTGQSWIPICRVAVPFFTVSMVSLTLSHYLRHTSGDSWTQYAMRRFNRLYVPFLLWSLVYLGLRFLKHQIVTSGSQPIVLSPATLLTGTAHHLWFLPFAFFVTLMVYPARRIYSHSPVRQLRMWGTLFFLVGLIFSAVPCPVVVEAVEHPVTYFIGMSWAAMPAVFYGGAAAALLPSLPGSATVWVGGVGFVLVGVLLPFEGMFANLQCLGGLFLWIVAQSRLSFVNPILVTAAGAVSFSLYLTHVAVVECLQVIAKKMNLVASIQTDLAVGSAALAVSLLLVVQGRRFKCLTPLFPL